LLTVSCSTPAPSGSKEVQFASGQTSEGKITEGQLQDSLFRFANRFSTQVHEGLGALESSPDANLRNQALLRRLIYNSSALDISLGPSPQANLLDMVAFIELSRNVWKDYWQPKVFKSQGTSMSKSFDEASQEIWNIAATVMNKTQMNQLASLIKRWSEKNPDQISVENVRFSEFSKEAGASAQVMKDEVGGLLASVQGATQVGDRALLFSERALFYAQRAPFLWRLQAQAGTREVLAEAMSTLASTQSILEQEPKIRSLLRELSDTFTSLSSSIAVASEHPGTLNAASNLLSKLAESLQQMNKTLTSPNYPQTLSQLAGVSGAIDATTNRFLKKLLGVGAALIVLFGLVSFLSRLAYFWVTSRMSKRRGLRPDTKRFDRAA
jgi:hypothetical protein